jgi:hypothetical protein
MLGPLSETGKKNLTSVPYCQFQFLPTHIEEFDFKIHPYQKEYKRSKIQKSRYLVDKDRLYNNYVRIQVHL